MNKWLAILLLYIGSTCYTVASYFHLSFREWTFPKAYAFAMAFVAVEYLFNVSGSKGAHSTLTVFQILILVNAFDILNLLVLNTFVLRDRINLLREGTCLVLLCVVVALSTNTLQVTR